jgi:hypothetical protein
MSGENPHPSKKIIMGSGRRSTTRNLYEVAGF